MLTPNDMKPGTLVEETNHGRYWAVVVDVQQLIESGTVNKRKGVPVIALEDGTLRWIRRSRIKRAGTNNMAVIEPITGILLPSKLGIKRVKMFNPTHCLCREDGVLLPYADAPTDYKLL